MAGPDGVLKIVGFIFGGVGIVLVSISAWLLTDAWDFNVVSGVFGLLGLIFVLVASLVLILPALGKRRRRLALTTGVSVKAKVTEVRITSFKVNGRHPWIIVAEHQDEELGRKLTFTSEYLWTDPTSYYPVSSTVTSLLSPAKTVDTRLCS